ncbi:MAG: NUDIX domain-containing protein [Mesorhizobium sp.]|nr:NUDIX domain-containing protein [Mesorhizobium sp.]
MNKKPPIKAVSVALYVDEAFLLVLRARQPAKGLYAFPGGRVEAGESAEAAAIREIREETGLVISAPEPFDDIVILGQDVDFELSVFLAHSASGTLQAGDDAAEAGWFSLADMAGLPITESTLAIARRIAAAHGKPA